jgi:hypothetical protein
MKKTIINKWNHISNFYNELDRSKKNIVMMLVFLVITLFSMQYLMLNSVDDYHQFFKKEQEIMQNNQSLLQQENQLSNESMAKSQIALMRKKNQLNQSIQEMIIKNKLFYTKDSDIPILLQNILQKTGNLTLLNLSNEENMKSTIQGTLLNKHFFNVKIQGSYQNIYDFMKKITEEKDIHIEKIIVQRDNNLHCDISFYIINQNKSLLNLGNDND